MRACREGARAQQGGPTTPCRGTCQAAVRAQWPRGRDRPAGATLLRAWPGRRARPRAAARPSAARVPGPPRLRRRGLVRAPHSPVPAAPAGKTRALRLGAERLEERTTLRGEARFEAGRAVAVAAGPRLGAVQIAAAAARVGVLHLLQIEVLLPVLTFFRQRGIAVADFHPLHASILVRARLAHVAEVFVAGDRTPAQRVLVDGPLEGLRPVRLHARRDEIAHGLL